MMRASLAILLLATLVPGLARAAATDAVTLDAKTLAAGQIRTAPLAAGREAPQITGYAVVLDPAPLAVLATRLVAARSTVAADEAKATLGRSEAARAENLYRGQHNVSMAVLQAAQSAAQVAAANLAMARAQLAQLQTQIRVDWGTTLAAAIASGAAPLPRIEDGGALLVQVSLPLGQGLATPPAQASATAPDGAPLALRLLGRSPRVAQGWGGASLFYLAPPNASAPIGTPLTVALDIGAARPGVIVPSDAVVWQGGKAIVYRQAPGGAGAFAPVPVPTSHRVPGGYFVAGGGALSPGDRVVVNGAGLLLSAASAPPAAAAAKPDND